MHVWQGSQALDSRTTQANTDNRCPYYLSDGTIVNRAKTVFLRILANHICLAEPSAGQGPALSSPPVTALISRRVRWGATPFFQAGGWQFDDLDRSIALAAESLGFIIPSLQRSTPMTCGRRGTVPCRKCGGVR
jgi:hypothetical protein